MKALIFALVIAIALCGCDKEDRCEMCRTRYYSIPDTLHYPTDTTLQVCGEYFLDQFDGLRDTNYLNGYTVYGRIDCD